MDIPEIISMNCPKCGATLSIPKEIFNLTCNNCKSNLTLFQNDSISVLKFISDNTVSGGEHTDIIALELTLNRLQKELSRLLRIQNSLIYMIAFVKISSYDLYEDERCIELNFSDRFTTRAKYAMIHIIDKIPGSPKRSMFSKELSSDEIRSKLKSSFTNEDFMSLISNYKDALLKITKNGEKLAVEKYIIRIEELININMEIEEKRNEILLIKSKLP